MCRLNVPCNFSTDKIFTVVVENVFLQSSIRNKVIRKLVQERQIHHLFDNSIFKRDYKRRNL